jgi:hypothetical protein
MESPRDPIFSWVHRKAFDLSVFFTEFPAPMRARYLDIVDFACSPHESVRPLLRRLRQTDIAHALVSRETSEHKGIV